MQLSLVEWLELYRLNKAAVAAVHQFDMRLMKLMHKYESDLATVKLLCRLEAAVHTADECLPGAASLMPQSEWLGGSSDLPQNHVLKEPTCVPQPRRRFTQEELSEAQAVCLGPCQWNFGVDAKAKSRDDVGT